MKRIVAVLIVCILLCSTAYAADKYDLNDYAYRTVRIRGTGSLVFQRAPRGSFMSDHKFWDGDRIYVNVRWRQNGYAIAYENGVYGYVDAKYIDWESGGSPNDRAPGSEGPSKEKSSSAKDLSNYGYRRVSTNGRGTLVFQREPRGAFMHRFTYNDGEWIYVNLSWRRDGYAMAYADGVYGYVDAKYIDW